MLASSLLILAGFLGTAVSSPVGRADGCTKLVVFGDSLSDNGNDYAYTNHTWPADPAYYKGRFSNGPVWVEDLAAGYHVELQDYAFGGATSNNTRVQGYTGANSTIPVPDTIQQSDYYLSHGKPDVANSFFIILIGANDIFFDLNTKPYQVAHTIASIVHKLEARGAKRENIVLVDIPDLKTIPYSAYVDAATDSTYGTFSVDFSKTISGLASKLGTKFFSFYAVFKEILDHPSKYGYTVTNKACLVGAYGEAPHSLCNDPEQYVFWDAFHPTRKTHQILAQAASKVIG